MKTEGSVLLGSIRHSSFVIRHLFIPLTSSSPIDQAKPQ
jgi:hypothetical protein